MSETYRSFLLWIFVLFDILLALDAGDIARWRAQISYTSSPSGIDPTQALIYFMDLQSTYLLRMAGYQLSATSNGEVVWSRFGPCIWWRLMHVSIPPRPVDCCHLEEQLMSVPEWRRKKRPTKTGRPREAWHYESRSVSWVDGSSETKNEKWHKRW